MALCNVCGSIPWRELITFQLNAQYGFRFNAAGRTTSTVSEDIPWRTRRCTIAEIVSRAKTCPLCAFVLLMMQQNTWVITRGDREGTLFAWDEIRAAIPRNMMVWMTLSDDWNSYKRLAVSLGNPRHGETRTMDLHLRLPFGNLDTHHNRDVKLIG